MLSNQTLEERYGGLLPREKVQMMIEDMVDTPIILTVIDQEFVPRIAHFERVTALLEANNRELENRRRVSIAAKALRDAQRAYLADRGNENLGRKVGEAAQVLDDALAGIFR